MNLTGISGWLTITALALLVAAFVARLMEMAYPPPIFLLGAGGLLFFVAGIPWSLTRGTRAWKIAYFGSVGFAVGGVLGLGIGAVTQGYCGSIGEAVLLLFGGFWLGAILLGWFGIWWAIRFHRRFDVEDDKEASGGI
jgi:hypothetical protein